MTSRHWMVLQVGHDQVLERDLAQIMLETLTRTHTGVATAVLVGTKG